MGFITKLLGGAVKAIVPSLTKERCKVESIDSLISKRGNATAGEVYVALGYKYLRLALYGYLLYNIISGNVSLGEILKTLAINL